MVRISKDMECGCADWCHLKGGHAQRAMAVINNLVVGLVLHLGWTNLPEARRYYDAHPQRLNVSSCVSSTDFGKAFFEYNCQWRWCMNP
jgi:hypothetical protein